jgi:hypothetical protein
MTYPPRPREPLTNAEAADLLNGAALLAQRDRELVEDIAKITHDDWLLMGTGPQWFVEAHVRGLCLVPFCDKCACCGSQLYVKNLVAADVFMCRRCLTGDHEECRDGIR